MASENPQPVKTPATEGPKTLVDVLDTGLALGFQAIDCAVAEEIQDLLARQQNHQITWASPADTGPANVATQDDR